MSSPKTQRLASFLKNVAIGGGLVGGAVAIGVYSRAILQIDAFANLRKPPPTGLDIGLTLTNVKVRYYKKADLQAKMSAAKVLVRRDRQMYDFVAITDGEYHSDDGWVKFTAPQATYNNPLHRIEAPGGAFVKNADLDLAVPDLTLYMSESKMSTNGLITGRLKDGQVQAVGMNYYVSKKKFDVGAVDWTGNLTIDPQDEGKQERSKWHIKAEHASVEKNIMTMPNAEASDGDIIVKADLVKLDRKTDILTATGHVRYYSLKTNMLCSDAVVDRKNKKAVFTNGVTMLLKAESEQAQPLAPTEITPFRPEVPADIAGARPTAPAVQDPEQQKLDDPLRQSDNRRKFPTTTFSDKIEYWYGKGDRHAIITGHPQARQDFPAGRWRKIWGDYATYDGEKEVLNLISAKGKQTTRMQNSIGDNLMAGSVTVSTKEGDDKLSIEHPVGDVYSDEDIPKEDNGKKPPTTKQPEPLKGKLPDKPPKTGGRR